MKFIAKLLHDIGIKLEVWSYMIWGYLDRKRRSK